MEQRPKLKAILSDWGKVLAIHDNRKSARALSKISGRPDASEVSVNSLVYHRHREIFDVLMCGNVSGDGYIRFLRDLLRIRGEVSNDRIERMFSDVFTRNEFMVSLLKRLRSYGIELIAVSNMDELRHRQLVEMGIHDLFDKHVLSYVIGVMKPSVEFYLRAKEISGINPENALFIDDHIENTDTAKAMGWHVWTYDHRDHGAFESFLDGFDIAESE